MRYLIRFATFMALSSATASFAINAQYAKQLERSGCTQLTELQGCDIHKTKAENATFITIKQAQPASVNAMEKGEKKRSTPYAGNWIALDHKGDTVAKIHINAKEKVWVNGKPIKARRSDGALVFKDKSITYIIQGDRRLQGEDTWKNWDTQSSGNIKNQ